MCQDGIMRAGLDVSPSEAGIPARGCHAMRAVILEARPLGGAPRPVAMGRGRALAVPCEAVFDEAEGTSHVVVDAIVPGHAGEDVEVVVERAGSWRAPALAALALLLAAAALSWLLGSWGDPTARKGHYEGKTTEEIQRDLDADVAWHSMEISVASRVAMPEGSTSCELRVENVEANHCDQRVRVWETGREDDVLFESGAIAPGEYLQWVELAHPLPVGIHMLTVEFQGYEQAPTLLSDEGVLLGHDTFGASCAAEVTLEVAPAKP